MEEKQKEKIRKRIKDNPDYLKNIARNLDLNTFKTQYQLTENPLYIWSCILLCIDEKINFPKWVKTYLKNAAETLINSEPKPDEKYKFNNILQEAIGVDGNDPKHFHKGEQRFQERGYFKHFLDQGYTEEDASTKVAEELYLMTYDRKLRAYRDNDYVLALMEKKDLNREEAREEIEKTFTEQDGDKIVAKATTLLDYYHESKKTIYPIPKRKKY